MSVLHQGVLYSNGDIGRKTLEKKWGKKIHKVCIQKNIEYGFITQEIHDGNLESEVHVDCQTFGTKEHWHNASSVQSDTEKLAS